MDNAIRNPYHVHCVKRYGGIDLSQGDSDLEVPAPVRERAKAAIDQGINAYTNYEGLAELRERIAVKQKQFTGLEIDPAKEIVVCSGVSGALLFCERSPSSG